MSASLLKLRLPCVRRPVLIDVSGMRGYFHMRKNKVAGVLARSVPVRAAPSVFEAPLLHTLGLAQDLQRALKAMDIASPTEVQTMAFPLVMQRKDVLIASHTGSGKTLAYLLPIVQELKRQEAEGYTGRPRRPRAVVIAPTRELANQIAGVVKQLSHYAKIRPGVQKRVLATPVDVVVGTPFSILNHMKQQNMSIGDVSFLVVDEADTLFDAGFGPDLFALLESLKKRRGAPPLSTILVSATVSPPVRQFLRKEFPDIQRAETSTLNKGIAGSDHVFVPLEPGRNKLEALCQVLSSNASNDRVMVFCGSMSSCRAVTYHLEHAGRSTVCFHGEMPIPARKVAVSDFTTRTVGKEQPVMVCTDLAARGLDMPECVHKVVNFDMPDNAVMYLHRAGRTARAGAPGTIVSLLQSAADRRIGLRIESALKNNEPLDNLTAAPPVSHVPPKSRILPRQTLRGKRRPDARVANTQGRRPSRKKVDSTKRKRPAVVRRGRGKPL